MLNNSNAVADRGELTIQESKGETSQNSQQRPPFLFILGKSQVWN